MINLSTEYAGLKLRNPLIAASSGLTNSISKIKKLDKAGVGAVVLKSLFEEQIDSHSEKLNLTSDYPEASDYINAYVEMNHVEKYLNLIREAKSSCNIPIIASINCYKVASWIDFAKSIEEAGADALELNIFLINTGQFGDRYLEESYIKIVREIKKVISIPIIIKMARTVSNLPGLVEKLQALGVSAVVLFNRFYQLDIDINAMEITSGPVFSHPEDFSETLRWTAITSGYVPNFNIACSYGVHKWEDIIKGLLAGATAMQLCSVLYEEGLEIIPEMIAHLEEWMTQNNYKSIEEFRGKLSYSNIPNPALYERAQFMKYFSNHK
ncbi:MAG TPA: dihydroorotate dehydrogenase-like protein [Dysgonamonadaceae bacterium]|nr:dihydroorotate dehydrogenase-like protein [Dysgonamonadaceae bacterium]